MAVCHSSSLLKKLDDAAKSFMYEHFTIQPLSVDYPVDAVIDYQLNKVTGQSVNIFDTNLDLIAFPELFGIQGRPGCRNRSSLLRRRRR